MPKVTLVVESWSLRHCRYFFYGRPELSTAVSHWKVGLVKCSSARRYGDCIGIVTTDGNALSFVILVTAAKVDTTDKIGLPVGYEAGDKKRKGKKMAVV